MSRILKRPMFRTGGSPNEGIMHGLVDRKGYSEGSARKTADEVYNLMKEMVPPPQTRLPLGQIGLNLASGQYAGDGFVQNLVRSAKGPYEQWTQADDAKADYDRQLRMMAAKTGIEQEMTMRQLASKNNPQSALYNVYLDQAIKDGYDGPKAQRYATYQTTMKQELENKVGASRISDDIIDFNMQDTTTKGNRNKIANLKKHVGKFVYDVFEGNIKLIQVVDGEVSYKTYNSVADIKADDLIPRTAEEEKVASKYDTPDFSDIGIGQQMLTP